MGLKQSCPSCGEKLIIRNSRISRRNPLVRTEYLACKNNRCGRRYKSILHFIYSIHNVDLLPDLRRKKGYRYIQELPQALRVQSNLKIIGASGTLKSWCPWCGSNASINTVQDLGSGDQFAHARCANLLCGAGFLGNRTLSEIPKKSAPPSQK